MASARRELGRPGPVPAAVASVAGVFFLLPLVGLAARAPWSRAVAALTAPFSIDALLLSAAVASASLLLSLLFGVPLALVLARGRFRGRALLRGLVTVPMVLPPVVAGIGLLSAFGRRGLAGAILQDLGVNVSLSTMAAILAAAFVSAPFLILALETGFARLDGELEDAARTLGAGETRVFVTVTLPALRPWLVTGSALCFARALGEFGATITFAGNLRGRTQTAPLAVFEAFQTDPGLAVMLSLLLLAFALVVVVWLRVRLEEP